MDHVASVPSATSGRMSPEAMGLALVLHAVAGLALWLAAHAPSILPKDEPIEVTIEKEKAPDPPPPPPQAQPKPLPPPPAMVEGLKPPAEITADKPTQVRPSGEREKDVAAAAPPSMEQPKPEKEVPPPPPGPAVTAIPTPARPPPPAPQTPRPQPQPSPLMAPHPSQQPPSVARHQEMPTPPSSPFVNPADERNRATAEQNYLWQVVSKLRGYRYHADVPLMEGLTVVQVVIARDGRLLDAEVVRSSGVAAMDQGVLAGIRQGAPYAPLPASLPGPSARFRLPLVSSPVER